jgi:NitT/TauT family transport system permease protein
MMEGEARGTPWFLTALRSSRIVAWFGRAIWRPAGERLDEWLLGRALPPDHSAPAEAGTPWWLYSLGIGGTLALVYGGYRAAGLLLTVPLGQWVGIGEGLLATFVRVACALGIALAWTVPLGVAIGSSPRLAAWMQPLVQIAASVPATALFPIFLLAVAHLPGGLNLAAVLLMLMGTQWYLLFNVIAGAAAIPQDLRFTCALLRLGRWDRWRTLLLPALLPFIVTGAITASGGAGGHSPRAASVPPLPKRRRKATTRSCWPRLSR